MGCDWPIDRTCFPPLPEVSDPPTGGQQAARDAALARRNNAEDLAVQVLWSLSGRQFGVCETTVRPCPRWNAPLLHDHLFATYPLTMTLDAGQWVFSPCGCLGSCTVSGPRVVHLPGPAVEVVAVTLDGITLASTEYNLEGDALYRKGTSWPAQDLGRPLGDTSTWSVTYTCGMPVPAGVDILTGALAKEFLAACDKDGKCRLPRTVVSTTQRGVTHVFDPSKILAAGKTGLPEVDMWLAAVNPHRLQAAPVVL